MMPGITQAPVASTTVVPSGAPSPRPIWAISPFRTRTSVCSSMPGWAIVRTVALRIRTSPPVRVAGTRLASVSTGTPSSSAGSASGSSGGSSSSGSSVAAGACVYGTPSTTTQRTRVCASPRRPSSNAMLPILPASSDPS